VSAASAAHKVWKTEINPKARLKARLRMARLLA
jgi:hypothetical protein